MLRGGVLDMGAVMCYLALILVVVLIIWRIRKRSNASAYALFAVMAALGLTLAFSNWEGRVPPAYVDLTPNRIATPSAALLDRMSDMPEVPVVSMKLADDTYAAPLLTKLQQRGLIRLLTSDAEDVPSGHVVVVTRNALASIPENRINVVNPASPDGSKRLFNLEAELLQALASCAMSSDQTIYRVAGPQDAERPAIVADALDALWRPKAVPFAIDVPVPEDCTFILMDNPQQDLTEQQASLLRSYLGRGGRLLLITDYVYGAMPNLNSALEEYGLQAIDGVVFDPSSAMGGRPEYPMPTVTKNHVIGRWLLAAGRAPLMPLSHGILVREIEGVDGTALLSTTEDAYCQLNGVEHASLDRGDEDPQGPFCLAAAAQMGNGKVVWIASADMMTAEADGDVGGANEDLLLSSMRWLMDAQVEPVAAKEIE